MTHIALTSCSFVNNLYTFKPSKSVLYMYLDSIPTATDISVSLDTGVAYETGADVAAAITSDSTMVSAGVTFAYSTSTGKLTASGAVGVHFYGEQYLSENSSTYPNSANGQLGFFSSDATPALSKVGDSPARFLYSTNLYVQSNLIASVVSNQRNLNNTMAIVPIANGFSYLNSYFADPSKNWLSVNDDTIDSLDVKIVDDDGEEFSQWPSNSEILLELSFIQMPSIKQGHLNNMSNINNQYYTRIN